MDPALLRRFWTIDLDPTCEDWLNWAGENDIDPILIDFIRQHPVHLRVDPSEVEPGTVCPNPASWHRVDQSLKHMGLAPKDKAGEARPPGMYAVLLGMVGTEAAISFCDFVENYELVVSAEDILDTWGDVKDVVNEFNAEGQGALIEKLAVHFADNEWKQKQAKNASAFTETLNDELLVHFWNKMVATNKVPNIQKLHKLIGQRVVQAVKASRNV